MAVKYWGRLLGRMAVRACFVKVSSILRSGRRVANALMHDAVSSQHAIAGVHLLLNVKLLLEILTCRWNSANFRR